MIENQQDNLQQFLSDLTELSRRYKIGITDKPHLFIMDNDDYERIYSCDADSVLAFV
jgi:hypothetical protein